MTDKLRQAAEMALEALEFSQKMGRTYEIREYHNEIAPQAMYALRQALNQLPDATKMIKPLSPDYKEITLDLLLHLTAAVDLLDKGGKKAAPSDTMFKMMIKDYKNSCERARQALAEPPNSTTDVVESEPLITKTEKGVVLHVGWDDLPVGTKLYAAPPKREWVGLTDIEIALCIDSRGGFVEDLARDIEAKLKEKNT